MKHDTSNRDIDFGAWKIMTYPIASGAMGDTLHDLSMSFDAGGVTADMLRQSIARAMEDGTLAMLADMAERMQERERKNQERDALEALPGFGMF